MDKDIKEILDYLKEDDDKDNWGYVKDKLLAYEEGIKLLDYITNLQEELDKTRLSELHKEYVINEYEIYLKSELQKCGGGGYVEEFLDKLKKLKEGDNNDD